jgi:hypothetical protein
MMLRAIGPFTHAPRAPRPGINKLSIINDYLLLANYSVGSDDKNLWLYRIKANQFVPLDSINLIKDMSLKQVVEFTANSYGSMERLNSLPALKKGLSGSGRRYRQTHADEYLKLVDTAVRPWTPRPIFGPYLGRRL